MKNATLTAEQRNKYEIHNLFAIDTQLVAS